MHHILSDYRDNSRKIETSSAIVTARERFKWVFIRSRTVDLYQEARTVRVILSSRLACNVYKVRGRRTRFYRESYPLLRTHACARGRRAARVCSTSGISARFRELLVHLICTIYMTLLRVRVMFRGCADDRAVTRIID